MKIDYNLAFLYLIAAKIECRFALICSDSAPNVKESINACASYSDLKKCYKKRKYKENKTNFGGTYLWIGLVDLAQNQNSGCPILREFAQKFVVFFLGSVGATDA